MSLHSIAGGELAARRHLRRARSEPVPGAISEAAVRFPAMSSMRLLETGLAALAIATALLLGLGH